MKSVQISLISPISGLFGVRWLQNPMKAVIVRAPMEFEVEDAPMPAIPERGLLLRVEACGLCGSDLRTLRMGHRKVTFPWTIGHEICGIVEEVGPGYHGPWRAGQRLAVGPLAYCGTCDFCLMGQPELCENYREIAQAWPGGFAEYVAIPGECVERGTILPAPDGIDPAFAAIIEPISSCVHAQEHGQIGLGDTVVIIGGGPIGCTHISLARARGAARIMLIDIVAERLQLARAFEPDAAIDAGVCDPVAEVRNLTRGKGADVVITATPAPTAVVQAVEMAKKGGRILLFGGLPKTDSKPGVDMNLVHYHALRLIGTTIFAPRHFLMALNLVHTGVIPADTLITHRFPLADFTRGAALALAGKALKAVFVP
jgi:L-iditol 2-dehydrogenase